MINKQKPVLDLYQALVELKGKLEQSGMHIHLDEMKFIDCEYKSDLNASGEQSELNSEALEALKVLVENVVSPVFNYCKNVVVKRMNIVENLQSNPDTIKSEIGNLRMESEELESSLEKLRNEQQKNIANMIAYLEKVLRSSNVTLEVPSKFTDEGDLEQLKQLLKEKDTKIAEFSKLSHDLQDETRKKNAALDELKKFKHHVEEMKQKIKVSLV